METVRTEKTSKSIKGAMVLGAVLVVGGGIAGWQGAGGMIPAYVAAAGVATYLGAKLSAWWLYG